MIHHIVAADDIEIAVLLFAVLFLLGIGAGGSEGNGGAIGRPGEGGADAVLFSR
jgi:hypothetical protein